MNVYAKTRYGYLLEATKTEIDNLLGRHYRCESLEPGQQIEVSERFKQLEHLSVLKMEIKEAQNLLRQCADTLDDIPPLIHNVLPEKE